jgi:hypothetical protein
MYEHPLPVGVVNLRRKELHCWIIGMQLACAVTERGLATSLTPISTLIALTDMPMTVVGRVPNGSWPWGTTLVSGRPNIAPEQMTPRSNASSRVSTVEELLENWWIDR